MPLGSILSLNRGGESSLGVGESSLGGGGSSPFSEACWCLGASWGQDGPKTPPRDLQDPRPLQDRFYKI